IGERSRTYFGSDVNYPAAWEPGGEDFFSPALMEADLMRRVMTKAEFATWFHRFLPGLARNQPKALLQPAVVTDPTHPKLVHLDGLNLSRAWCMRSIANALPHTDATRGVLVRSAVAHAQAALLTSPAAIMKVSTGWHRLRSTCSRRPRRDPGTRLPVI